MNDVIRLLGDGMRAYNLRYSARAMILIMRCTEYVLWFWSAVAWGKLKVYRPPIFKENYQMVELVRR